MPGPVCKLIETVFAPGNVPPSQFGDPLSPDRRSKNIETLAFNVVALLLGAAGSNRWEGDGWAIPTKVFQRLGAAGGKYTYQDVQALIAARIITKVRLSHHRQGRAAEYALSSEVIHALQDSSDTGLFAGWSNFQKRDRIRPVPIMTIDGSFSAKFGTDASLRAAIAQLQQVGICFDKKACLKFLASNPPGLTPTRINYLLAFVSTLHDGPNYPHYRLVESGRIQTFGCPSLQNVPRTIRKFFYAAEGYRFLDFDFKAQEPHILAHLSGDAELLRDLKGDLYEQIALLDPALDRDMAKTIVNGIVNGGGEFQLAKEAFEVVWGTPSKQMQGIIRAAIEHMKVSYPTSMQWLDSEAQKIVVEGQAASLSGLVRVLPKNEKSGLVDIRTARKKGISHVLQGTGADIMRHLLKTLPGQLKGLGVIALPMHDGLLVMAKDTDLLKVRRRVLAAMDASVTAVLPGLAIPKKTMLGWRQKNDCRKNSNLHP